MTLAAARMAPSLRQEVDSGNVRAGPAGPGNCWGKDVNVVELAPRQP